jgi:hypothetical protein
MFAVLEWFQFAQVTFYEYNDKPRSIKGEEFLDQLGDYQLLKKDYALRSYVG